MEEPLSPFSEYMRQGKIVHSAHSMHSTSGGHSVRSAHSSSSALTAAGSPGAMLADSAIVADSAICCNGTASFGPEGHSGHSMHGAKGAACTAHAAWHGDGTHPFRVQDPSVRSMASAHHTARPARAACSPFLAVGDSANPLALDFHGVYSDPCNPAAVCAAWLASSERSAMLDSHNSMPSMHSAPCGNLAVGVTAQGAAASSDAGDGAASWPLPRVEALERAALDSGRAGPIAGLLLGPLVGRGSYGRVHRGIFEGRPVAIKVRKVDVLFTSCLLGCFCAS